MVNASNLSSIIAAGIIGGSTVTFSIKDINGLCVDLANASPVDFNPIIIFPCHLDEFGQNQEWIFTNVNEPNVFSITNALQNNSVLAYPTVDASPVFQGTVARLNSGITWLVEAADPIFGPTAFNLIETSSGAALTSFASPLTLQTFNGPSDPSHFFNITVAE